MTQSLMTEQVAAWIALIAISSVVLQGAKVRATTFEVTNKCPYTVWAAASPGGGQQLAQGQSWTFQPDAGASSGRIWGRTGCSFNGSGQGSCQTGDCDGLLECKGMGSGPTTLVEYSLNTLDLDFYDISLVDGFNLPLSINPTSRNPKCQGRIACLSDVNSRCPNELKLSGGGCQSGCYKYKTDDHCCRGTAVSNCSQTLYSTFFKDLCPDTYSYAKDAANTNFTCPTGDDYQIVFCGKTDSVFALFLYITINDDE